MKLNKSLPKDSLLEITDVVQNNCTFINVIGSAAGTMGEALIPATEEKPDVLTSEESRVGLRKDCASKDFHP